MIKHILIPLDFSDCSINALKYATEFAAQVNPMAKLSILHAYTVPLAYADMNMTHDLGMSQEEITSHIDQEYAELEKKVPLLKRFEYKKLSHLDYVQEAVEKYAAENHIDLIIMGTKGASGLDEVVLGSNAHRIVKSGIAPTLVIPEEAQFQNIKQIGLSSDYKGIGPHVLDPVKTIAKYFHSEIQVIHIDQEVILNHDKSEEAKNLDMHLQGFAHKYHFLVDADVEFGIHRFIKQKNIDLLVVLPRKKGLFQRLFQRSETKDLIFHTKIPLLALVSDH